MEDPNKQVDYLYGMDDIYPLTVTTDRYTGTYSGGLYTAWNMEPEYLPEDIYDSDSPCRNIWDALHETPEIPIGYGDTIMDAIKDLQGKLDKMKEEGTFEEWDHNITFGYYPNWDEVEKKVFGEKFDPDYYRD